MDRNHEEQSGSKRYTQPSLTILGSMDEVTGGGFGNKWTDVAYPAKTKPEDMDFNSAW